MTKSLFALVGMKHRGTEALVASLPNGEPLLLVREQNNRHDPFAVQVWWRGQHVGYVKGSQVSPIAMALDRGVPHGAPPPQIYDNRAAMPARLAIDGGKWPMCEIEE